MFRILLLLCLFMITCLNVNAEEFMVKALNSWKGYSIDDVIASWGYPNNEKQIAGRNLVYWTNGQYHISGNQYYISGEESYCTKILEIDKNKKVISWQYEGNSCPNFYFTGSSLINPQNNEWEKQKQLKQALKQEKKLLNKKK